MRTATTFIIVIGILVFFHEFGHFILAKISGIKVQEFSLGFGPAILKIEFGETNYCLRVLPLGGYVKMEGEDGDSDHPRSFNNKSPIQRLGVIIAGPSMNFLLAILFISIVAFQNGIATTTVQTIPGQPADLSGIKAGDRLYSIDDNLVYSWDEIVDLIGKRPNKNIKVTVVRDSRHMSFDVSSSMMPEDQRGIIGITSEVIKGSITKSILHGFRMTVYFSKIILSGLGKAIMGKMELDISGPLGMAGIIGSAAKAGIANLLYITSIISINLGLLNLLPIPSLDGGRIAFLVIEIIRGRPVEPEKEGFVHFIGFAMVMGFMAFILFKDIKMLLSNLKFNFR